MSPYWNKLAWTGDSGLPSGFYWMNREQVLTKLFICFIWERLGIVLLVVWIQDADNHSLSHRRCPVPEEDVSCVSWLSLHLLTHPPTPVVTKTAPPLQPTQPASDWSVCKQSILPLYIIQMWSLWSPPTSSSNTDEKKKKKATESCRHWMKMK